MEAAAQYHNVVSKYRGRYAVKFCSDDTLVSEELPLICIMPCYCVLRKVIFAAPCSLILGKGGCTVPSISKKVLPHHRVMRTDGITFILLIKDGL